MESHSTKIRATGIHDSGALHAAERSRTAPPHHWTIAAALLTALFVMGWVVMGCGPNEAPDLAEEADAPAADISGHYEVRGVTATTGGSDKRKISGSVILVQTDDRYTATFELKTKFPGEGEATDADVIGIGEGEVAGTTLNGTTSTQLVISSVPGVDTGFAFVPRMVSTRIESNSEAHVQADGSITIVLENRPAPGEDYTPTRTRLTGRRVSGTTPSDLVTTREP